MLHYISFEIWVVKYRWSMQIPKGQYRDHLVGQLTIKMHGRKKNCNIHISGMSGTSLMHRRWGLPKKWDNVTKVKKSAIVSNQQIGQNLTSTKEASSFSIMEIRSYFSVHLKIKKISKYSLSRSNNLGVHFCWLSNVHFPSRANSQLIETDCRRLEVLLCANKRIVLPSLFSSKPTHLPFYI